jgi:hydrogenase maturation protease
LKDIRNSALLLGMGSDILGDDAIGLLAARALREEFQQFMEITEAMTGGLKIMELLEGYEKVLILDAIMTKQYPAGSILELTKEQFKKTVAIAPHFVSLPEAIELAERLGIRFPKEIRILAMEINNPYQITEELTPAVKAALPEFVRRARTILLEWARP